MTFRLFIRWVALFSVVLGFWVFLDACGGEKKEECQVNQDCQKGYYCHKKLKKCLKLFSGCKADTDCDKGETCQDGKCIKGAESEPTPQEFTPTDGGTTDNSSTESAGGACGGRQQCTDQSECQNGEKCVNGCCSPGCDANTPCPSGLYCKTDTQECVECLTDDHCGTSDATCKNDCGKEKIKRCINNTCQESACECPLGTTCDKQSGQCKQGVTCPGGGQPDANGKCPQKCANANCPSGQTPDPDNNCKCIPKKNWCEPCTRDAECGLNGRCVTDANNNKFCAEDCTVSRKCGDPAYSCLTLGSYSACFPNSGSCPCLGVTCPTGQMCCKSDGACHECCADSDCPAGKVCRIDGTCGDKDPCKNVTCNPGQTCNPNTGKCEGGNNGGGGGGGNSGKCNPPCQGGTKCCNIMGQYQCLQQCPSGGSCVSDSDCKPGETCCSLLGATKMCVNASDPIMKALCSFGGGGGGGSCQSDADCPTGQKCCQSFFPPGKSCKTKCGFP